MKKILKMMISLFIVVLIFGQGVVYADAPIEPNVKRVQGIDRYQTALATTEYWVSADFVVIGSGENFADALFGGPLASQVKGPLLLTKKDSLPDGLLPTLKELSVQAVYLLGGENSISKSVEDELKEAGYSVIRVAGKDRRETAAYINLRAGRLMGLEIIGDSESFIVSDTTFADALSAGPYVHFYRKQFGFSRFMPAPGKYADMPIGGAASVPPIEKEKRIAGADRYQTAVEIAKSYKTVLNKEIQTIVLVDGTRYPDALSATPIATKRNGTVLLTRPDKLNEDTAKFIEESGVTEVIIFGGVNSVSENVENEVREILKKAGASE